ncbi:hypothetical protein CLV84_2290 [Neolewinella xylanilytica]|uniref:Uncharacterized protein n=2 Tax=Neolewinella xylanilytica TaxID=1514080 RepID=A0A2S6I2I4_9BACT|nr:hypothetical protein CLV84_2290 [Neolewinella xylanilytica]
MLRPLPRSAVRTACLDRVFQLCDLLFLFDSYERVSNLLSSCIRPLSESEVNLLYPIFGDSVPYHRIRLDERARIGPRRYGLIYVSFHTINSWGPIPLPILVHEVVHVWQYVNRGAIYIPRALAAQRSRMGYDYGGLEGLRGAYSLDDFNYEQMAALVEDAYRLEQGLPLRYLAAPTPEARRLLRGFTRKLKSG